MKQEAKVLISTFRVADDEMEEKKPFELKIECSLCVNYPTCANAKSGLCRMFAPSEAAFSVKVGDYLKKDATEGFTFRQVVGVVARSEKPCIMFRKKWGDNKFVWIVGFLKADDPWGKESHRRTKEAGYTLFKEEDEDTPVLVCWGQHARGARPGVAPYTPDNEDLGANDWCFRTIAGEKKYAGTKTADGKADCGKTGCSCAARDNERVYAESEFGPLMDILKALSRRDGHIKSGIRVTSCDSGVVDLSDFIRSITDQRIMDGLDALLK